MRVKNENILLINNVVVVPDMAANFNLKPLYMGHVVNYSIQLVFTGTPNGSFKIQGSDDTGNPTASSETQQYAGVVNWTDLANTAVEVNAAGSILYELENSSSEWVRVVYTAAGAGTDAVLSSARAKTKGI